MQSGPSAWPSCTGRPLRPGPAEEFPEEEAYVLVHQGSELHGGAHGPRVPVPRLGLPLVRAPLCHGPLGLPE